MEPDMLSFDKVSQQLRYEPETGKVFWRNEALGGFKKSVVIHAAGDEAGCIRKDGRVVIRVGDKLYMRYRIAWLLETGDWPVGEIDHINGISSDDRFVNLRDVSRQTNQQNIRKAVRGKKSSSMLGVYANKPGSSKPWIASIQAGGKNIYLGAFCTEKDAAHAYLVAKRVLHAGCTL